MNIYEGLVKAKEIYLKNNSLGMLGSLKASFINENGINPSYYILSKNIPEFNPKFLNGRISTWFKYYPGLYHWWDINDCESRIKAFDTLINIYKKTNKKFQYGKI